MSLISPCGPALARRTGTDRALPGRSYLWCEMSVD